MKVLKAGGSKRQVGQLTSETKYRNVTLIFCINSSGNQPFFCCLFSTGLDYTGNSQSTKMCLTINPVIKRT